MVEVLGEGRMGRVEGVGGVVWGFEVVVWMRDGWGVYEGGVKGEVEVMRKGYREGIEGDKVNVREDV